MVHVGGFGFAFSALDEQFVLSVQFLLSLRTFLQSQLSIDHVVPTEHQIKLMHGLLTQQSMPSFGTVSWVTESMLLAELCQSMGTWQHSHSQLSYM